MGKAVIEMVHLMYQNNTAAHFFQGLSKTITEEISRRHLINQSFLKDSWVQTYTGKQFFPLMPSESMICIEDIAHALGKVCRFNGHTIRFYSVAEHSVYVSRYVSEKNALWGLLHDATEAYLGDIVRPLKPFLNGYRKIEENLGRCIAEKFNLEWPMPDEIKQVDTAILYDESEQVMSRKPQEWPQLGLPPLGIVILGFNYDDATRMFLERYNEIRRLP